MIILDTHVLIWFEQGDRRLRLRAVRAIQRAFAARQVAVSTMTFWEVATALAGGHELATADRRILAWTSPLRRLSAGR